MDDIDKWELELSNPCPHKLVYPLEPKPPGSNVAIKITVDHTEVVTCIGCGAPAPKTIVEWEICDG